MILPQVTSFTAIITATFNQRITLYQALPRSQWRGNWTATANYPIAAAVLGSNGTMYQALTANLDNDPTTDGGTNWIPLTLFDLTGYSSVFQVGTSLTLSDGTGVTAGGVLGTLDISINPSQTSSFTPGRQHFYLQLTKTGNVIYPVKGTINFISP